MHHFEALILVSERPFHEQWDGRWFFEYFYFRQTLTAYDPHFSTAQKGARSNEDNNYDPTAYFLTLEFFVVI